MLFLSQYTNSVDKKGRVSVPATYRSIVLDTKDSTTIVIYPSVKHQCLEACTMERLEEVALMIQRLDVYSDERDALETTILGQAVQLNFDSDGRVLLPKYLVDFAEITDHACFIGKGQVFEIWNPELFETHLKNARELAKNSRLSIKNAN